ncbi:hypothetical protein B0H15DRAFT_769917 [Mycena belliarum]|uniref:Uncharacterized protein n=1 Tax=Mycena belliarum TaxID=1033014 RepID=A0AAD6UE99_9AGAR|nr:hypothetical protein B0H15DRAFT_769917 [Mycena belliae]
MLPSLPVELVREIVACILVSPPDNVFYEPSRHPKPDWSLISSFSVASKAYRALALEAWFRALFMKSPAHFSFIQHNLPEIRNSWTRKLYCLTTYHRYIVDESQWKASSWDLTGFRRLLAIRLDCRSLVVTSPSGAYRFPFRNIPNSVTELELRGLRWPSPFVFETLADTFPELRILRLSQHRVWCGLCHACTTVRFAEPAPSNIVYNEGLGLPIHYARMLSTLQQLHTVSIAMSYSEGTSIHLNPDDPSKDLWSGECDACVGLMYVDVAFREDYMARKRGTHLAEPSKEFKQLYIKPPALKIVIWTFHRLDVDDGWDDEETDEESDDEGATLSARLCTQGHPG